MKVLYAGSFNPWHNGHQYVYNKACRYFGKENVIVGIGCNPSKVGNAFDRAEFVKWSLVPLKMKVEAYSTLTSKFCMDNNIDLIVRGVRPGKSLEYEEDMMYWNMKLGDIETIFIPTPPELNQLSSSVIRELDSFREDVIGYVPNRYALERWKKGRLPKKTIYFGRSCMGKSTYLKNFKNVLNVDVAIWEYLAKKVSTEYTVEFKAKLKDLFERGENEEFKKELGWCIQDNVDFKEFLGDYEAIDFSAFGNYMGYVHYETFSEYYITKIETHKINRYKFMNARGVTQEKLNKLDSLFEEPEFYDSVIEIK